MKFRHIASVIAFVLFVLPPAFAGDIPDVTFKTKELGNVTFNHRLHLKQKALKNNCKSCHNTLYSLKKKVTYTMLDMEKGKSCGACHDGKKAFGIAKCILCHKAGDVRFAVKETGPVLFSHSNHTAIFECRNCHAKLYEAGPNKKIAMAQMEKGKSCGACHNGKSGFPLSECTKCHPVKEIDFKVKDAGDVKFSHTSHIGMYPCGECHDKLYLPSPKNRRFSMAEMEKGSSCGACHGAAGAFTVKENCDRCHKM